MAVATITVMVAETDAATIIAAAVIAAANRYNGASQEAPFLHV